MIESDATMYRSFGPILTCISRHALWPCCPLPAWTCCYRGEQDGSAIPWGPKAEDKKTTPPAPAKILPKVRPEGGASEPLPCNTFRLVAG